MLDMIINNVCHFTLARRLKELSVTQTSCFYYTGATNTIQAQWEVDKAVNASAFTCSELGVLLPDYFRGGLWCTKADGKWHIGYGDWNAPGTAIFREEREVNARARLLVYMLDNKFVAAEELQGVT